MPPSKKHFTHSFSMPSIDEQRWVINIRETLDEELEQDVHIPVAVFAVPKPLLVAMPEAYNPQMFAIGPYHHWHPQLYDTERYKLATAKRTHKLLQDITLEQLVDEFIRHETAIRAYYHRYLDFTGETLAWMMAIDASFLVEFLRNYNGVGGKTYKRVPSMSQMVDAARVRQAYNMIVRDVVMLENQIPLFLVREILRHQNASPQAADDELSKMLLGFVIEVCPFSIDDSVAINVADHAHLLAFLYSLIVPKSKREEIITFEIEDIHKEEASGGGSDDSGEPKCLSAGYVRNLFNSVWESIPEGTLNKLKKIFVAGPVKVLVKLPWNIISSLPMISVLKEPIESLFMQDGGKDEDEDSKTANKPPLVEEISIPSVTELTRAGVKFSPTKGNLKTIQFDIKTATLHLPIVSLDANTGVLMRNLVAYETTVEAGPMIFTRYTELINGIIDTDEDVKLLRDKGIIRNRMKSDGEVANLWNGMSKCVRLTKVPKIDKVIVDVNKYYNSRWGVKTRKFMKKYVLGSWQFLAFLGCILLLLLTCVQAVCSVYSCRAHWSAYLMSTTSGGNSKGE